MADAKLKKVRVGDLKPNPFRDMKNYQLSEAKLEALDRSFEASGWWSNILGREVDGGVEIAYGHHRTESLRRKYGDNHEVAVLVKPLTNDDMLRIMVQENQDAYGTSTRTAIENVRQTVKAYAAGEIVEMLEPDGAVKTGVRGAPSFVPSPGARPDHPYTIGTIADYLNIHPDVVKDALTTLEEDERGTFSLCTINTVTV